MISNETLQLLDNHSESNFQHSLLRLLPFKNREQVAGLKAQATVDALQKILGKSLFKNGFYKDSKNYFSQIDQLKKQGYLNLGKTLSDKQLEEISAHFANKPCYDGHVASAAKNAGKPKSSRESLKENGSYFASYGLEDVISAPHLLELFKNDQTLELIGNYLGCPPTVYSINCWWSFANGTTRAPTTQLFHRDPDDFRFVSLFVYLTDTDKGNGSHEIFKGSHDYETLTQYLTSFCTQKAIGTDIVSDFLKMSLHNDGNSVELDQCIENFFNENIVDLHGPRGTSFIEDTWSLHRGVPFSQRDRLVIWCRYGIGVNSETRLNGQPAKILSSKLLNSELQQYSFRKLVKKN